MLRTQLLELMNLCDTAVQTWEAYYIFLHKFVLEQGRQEICDFIVLFTLIGNDHLGNRSPEKDCS